MTYLEVILLIQDRCEKVLSDKVLAIQTDKHVYIRMSDGNWEEQEKPEELEKFAPFPYEIPKPSKVKRRK